MKDDEFTKLFNYMQDRFNDMEERFEQTSKKTDSDQILRILDGVFESADILETVRVAQNSQHNRVEAAVGDFEERIARLEKKAA